MLQLRPTLGHLMFFLQLSINSIFTLSVVYGIIEWGWFVCMYSCMYVCMHGCMFVYLCICMYVCMYACMYLCMYAMHVSYIRA